jgi:hypothetical protein
VFNLNGKSKAGRGRKPFTVNPVKGPVAVPLAALVMHPEYQIRGKQVSPRDSAVRAYMGAYRAGVAMPPIQVIEHDDAYVLVDGWHRVTALKAIGWETVEAEVIQGLG